MYGDYFSSSKGFILEGQTYRSHADALTVVKQMFGIDACVTEDERIQIVQEAENYLARLMREYRTQHRLV